MIFHTIRFYLFFTIPVTKAVMTEVMPCRYRSERGRKSTNGGNLFIKKYTCPGRVKALAAHLGGGAQLSFGDCGFTLFEIIRAHGLSCSPHGASLGRNPRGRISRTMASASPGSHATSLATGNPGTQTIRPPASATGQLRRSVAGIARSCRRRTTFASPAECRG